VVISKAGTAQVCDYGLSPIISNPIFTIAATPGVSGSSWWLAPEIINTPRKASLKLMTASKSADIFAFAMLAVEVFTGKVPFRNMKNESVVIQIAGGKRPDEPQAAKRLGLSAEMWRFIEKCWSANPSERPAIDEVVRIWEGFVNGYVIVSFGFGSRCITSRDNSRISVSKASRRQSHFAEPSNTYSEKYGKPS
jgi:serine/threonine protein kinase